MVKKEIKSALSFAKQTVKFVYSINQRNRFIVYQVRVVRHSVRQWPHTFKQMLIAVIHSHIVDFSFYQDVYKRQSRHEAGIDRTAHDTVDKHQLAAPLQRNCLNAFRVHLELLPVEVIGFRHRHAFIIEMCIRERSISVRILFWNASSPNLPKSCLLHPTGD